MIAWTEQRGKEKWWKGKAGKRALRQGAGTGQVGQAGWRGQLGPDNGGRTAMAEKIQQDC
jgi:hypothetical protein